MLELFLLSLILAFVSKKRLIGSLGKIVFYNKPLNQIVVSSSTSQKRKRKKKNKNEVTLHHVSIHMKLVTYNWERFLHFNQVWIYVKEKKGVSIDSMKKVKRVCRM